MLVGQPLPDGVLLFSDSCMHTLHPDGSLSEPRYTSKILQVNDRIFGMPAGLSDVGAAAILSLQAVLVPEDTVESLGAKLQEAMERFWSKFLETHPQALSHPQFRHAVVFLGGLIQDRPFLLVGVSAPEVGTNVRVAWNREVYPPEEQALNLLNAQPMPSHAPWDATGPFNPAINAHVEGITRGIGAFSRHSPLIGGRVYFALLRRGFSPLFGESPKECPNPLG